MDAKEFHAAARRIEGLQRKLCETEVERDAWKIASVSDSCGSAREQLGARDDESLSDAINRVVAERDEMKEEIKQANKEASDATARQLMTQARALNYSLQADEARREIERLRAKLASRTVEWPEWAKVGARVRVRSNDCMTTQHSGRVVGEELVISKVDRRDWTIRAESFGWVHVSDLEPVAEHTQPAVEYVDRVGVRQGDAPLVVSPQVGDTVRLIKRPSTADYDGRQWDHTWGEAGEIAVVNYVGLDSRLYVNRANGWKNDWPLSCVEVVKGGDK